MSKDKFKNFQNPLISRNKSVELDVREEIKEDKIKFIYKYGRSTNISSSLLKYIDFEDKKFINRIYNNIEDLNNEELADLKNSILEIGLLNTIYLVEKDEVNEKKFTIVSGLRRLLAIKSLSEDGEEIKEINKVVIFNKETPYEFLNKMSIDENTKRKDLTILELSYKLRKDAKDNKKSIEVLLDEHNLNRRKFFRITKVMDYPKPLRDIVDEIGVNKAETINKIFKFLRPGETIEDIILSTKNLSERDLTAYYKERSKKEKNKIEIKINNKQTELTIKVRKKVDSKVLELVEEFKKKLETL